MSRPELKRIGRAHYLVASATRKRTYYVVDLEGDEEATHGFCSCPGWALHRDCWHIREARILESRYLKANAA